MLFIFFVCSYCLCLFEYNMFDVFFWMVVEKKKNIDSGGLESVFYYERNSVYCWLIV